VSTSRCLLRRSQPGMPRLNAPEAHKCVSLLFFEEFNPDFRDIHKIIRFYIPWCVYLACLRHLKKIYRGHPLIVNKYKLKIEPSAVRGLRLEGGRQLHKL